MKRKNGKTLCIQSSFVDECESGYTSISYECVPVPVPVSHPVDVWTIPIGARNGNGYGVSYAVETATNSKGMQKYALIELPAKLNRVFNVVLNLGGTACKYSHTSYTGVE